jgi:ABC-type phosphate transport system substrate-binding protein
MLRTNLLRTTAFAGVIAFASTGAIAQTLYAGGSTLAQPTYALEFTEIQAVNPGLTYDYYGVGSGKGQTAFLNNDSTQFGLAAGLPVAFGASDAALSTAQAAAWSTSGQQALAGNLIQLPIFGTPVTLAFEPGAVGTVKLKNTTKTTKGVTTTNGSATFKAFAKNGAVTLTDADLLGIFSGKITDWSQISASTTLAAGSYIGTAPAVTSTTGTSITQQASPIKVVVRGDGSGTTFLFTQHLAAVQAANPGATAPGVTFTTTKTFSSIFGGTLPSNFDQQTGSGGVATELETTAGAIGYLSPDYTSIATASANSAHNTLLVAKVANATTGLGVLPNTSGTKAALKTATFAVTDATSGANPVNWVPLVANPTAGYPIVGYTEALFAQCYSNTSIAAAVKLFINGNISTSAIPSFISGVAPDGVVLADNGFVPVPSAIAKLVTAHIVGNTGKAATKTAPATYWNLDIGNATACKGLAGR